MHHSLYKLHYIWAFTHHLHSLDNNMGQGCIMEVLLVINDIVIMVLSLTMIDVTHDPDYYTNWHPKQKQFSSAKHNRHLVTMLTMLNIIFMQHFEYFNGCIPINTCQPCEPSFVQTSPNHNFNNAMTHFWGEKPYICQMCQTYIGKIHKITLLLTIKL